jgi:hypothetical protein
MREEHIIFRSNCETGWQPFNPININVKTNAHSIRTHTWPRFFGTISEWPEFFRIVSENWQGRVLVISNYDCVHELERDLEEYNILYERPIAVPHGVSKAEIIEKEEY